MTALVRGSREAGSLRTYTPGLRKLTALDEDFCASIGGHPWAHGTTHQLQELVGTRGVDEAFIA